MRNIEKYLNEFYKGTKDTNLEAMKYLMNEYDNIQDKMKFIHIAGTNGKGSSVEMISNILVSQGYKVGKFISPHLVKYNERISINRENISDEDMSRLIEELEPKIDKYYKKTNKRVTFFELMTTIALIYFYRKNVDFVILETGLGGLYDCTNIINNTTLVSIITSIGYDHMHILGNTLPEIAYQKAGIIKESSSTVIFKQSSDIDKVFISICKEKNNNLHIINENNIKNYSYDEEYQYFDYKDLNKIAINLKSKKQIQNAAICIETVNILKKLGYRITDDNIKKGLKTVIHKGRMETLNKNPLIIYDGAHNAPAIQNFKDTVNMYYSKLKRVYIISILKRKDYRKMLELLLEDKEATFILTSGNDEEKYVSNKELYEIAVRYSKNVYIKTLEKAVQFAINAPNDTVNFIIGSFYTYGTVEEEIKKKEKENIERVWKKNECKNFLNL